jgi:hypothetical protein
MTQAMLKGMGHPKCVQTFNQRSGSGSVSQIYGSGSGSFHHQEKIVSKTLISSVLCLYDFFSLKNDVNVPSKGNKQITLEKNNLVLAS